MSRRIGTLTFHNANNYGATLQAYALQKFLEKLYPNDTVEVIDYKCKGVRNQKSLKHYIKSQGLVSGVIHFLLALLRIRQIDRFCNEYIKKSSRVNSRDDLRQIAKEYDFIISGSDQVWNRKWTGGEDTYLQDFHDSSKKKLSYAASFGVAELPNEWNEDYKRLLRDFSGVSVREEEGKKICENIGAEAKVHIDPTLLLTKEEWNHVADKKLNVKKPYVLAYLVPYQETAYKKAEEIARKHDLDIYVVSKSIKHFGKQYKGFSSVGRIVALFKNAAYVVTNSFHGTAFSIIYQRRFALVLNNKWGYNIRSAQLISVCGIADLNKRPDIIECFDIDWEEVIKLITKQQYRTIEFFADYI